MMTNRAVWNWSCMLLKAVLLLMIAEIVSTKHAWEGAGCHHIGHTRKISIPDCVEFDITTNACRGFCESYSVPSTWDLLRTYPNQIITSFGQCCSIMETEDIKVKVMCLGGARNLIFKSAKSCDCFHCKKG